jgi:hypothetical protein
MTQKRKGWTSGDGLGGRVACGNLPLMVPSTIDHVTATRSRLCRRHLQQDLSYPRDFGPLYAFFLSRTMIITIL